MRLGIQGRPRRRVSLHLTLCPTRRSGDRSRPGIRLVSAIVIREATEQDLPAILHAYSSAGIDGGQSFTVEEAREHFARFRAYPDYRVFVALEGGTVAGTYALLIADKLAKRGAR